MQEWCLNAFGSDEAGDCQLPGLTPWEEEGGRRGGGGSERPLARRRSASLAHSGQVPFEIPDAGGGITEFGGTGGSAGAELRPEFRIGDQGTEGLCEGCGVAWGDLSTARFLDDFLGASEGGGDDGQTGIQRLDENDTEGFWPEVRLAVDVGGVHELGHVTAFTEEGDLAVEAKVSGPLDEGFQVGALFRGLGAAGDPAGPVWGRGLGKAGESVEQEFVSFPRFEAGRDEKDGLVGGGAEGFPE